MLANSVHTDTYTHQFNGPFPGLPGWAGTRKVKPICILPKQDTASGSGRSWDICKSAPHSTQTTMPALHHSVFLQAGCPSCRLSNNVKALKAPLYTSITNTTCSGQRHMANTVYRPDALPAAQPTASHGKHCIVYINSYFSWRTSYNSFTSVQDDCSTVAGNCLSRLLRTQAKHNTSMTTWLRKIRSIKEHHVRLNSSYSEASTHTHNRLTAPFLGLPGWAGTRPILTPILFIRHPVSTSSSYYNP